ncbi:SEL1-like repeat protein [Paramagnetospirillum magnetotacticum]|uniref:hypothetical protein n=1 Tax=Paramagnetospirillum magnetotacticum TaxID=188 RepID=UPI0005973CB7|nr:hypothetical protein [Paramagnetospirillum magnetotacticum]
MEPNSPSPLRSASSGGLTLIGFVLFLVGGAWAISLYGKLGTHPSDDMYTMVFMIIFALPMTLVGFLMAWAGQALAGPSGAIPMKRVMIGVMALAVLYVLWDQHMQQSERDAAWLSYEQEIKRLTEMAQQGDGDAQCRLGHQQRSIEWFAKAALQGKPCATELQRIYEERGTDANLDWATKYRWYLISQMAGNSKLEKDVHWLKTEMVSPAVAAEEEARAREWCAQPGYCLPPK